MLSYRWISSVILLTVLILSACQPVMPVEVETTEGDVIVTDAADLIGVWHVLGIDFDFYHEFNEDGTFRAAESPDLLADSPLLVGEFWFDEERLYMKEIEVFGIPPCGDELAIYKANIVASGNLNLTKIEDNCEPRVGSTEREHAPVRS